MNLLGGQMKNDLDTWRKVHIAFLLGDGCKRLVLVYYVST